MSVSPYVQNPVLRTVSGYPIAQGPYLKKQFDDTRQTISDAVLVNALQMEQGRIAYGMMDFLAGMSNQQVATHGLVTKVAADVEKIAKKLKVDLQA